MRKGAHVSLAAALFFALTGVGAAPAIAQPLGNVQTEVLVLDANRLFLETKYGKALRDEYEAERAELIESNEKTQVELEAEEKDLTAKRRRMTPEAFRALADAFDEKVQKLRDDTEQIGVDLELKRDQAPAVFLHRVQPILEQLMKDSGAVAILEASNVLLRRDDIDITDRAIQMIDEQIGDGSSP